MPAGDAQRVWFPEMLDDLRSFWSKKIAWETPADFCERMTEKRKEYGLTQDEIVEAIRDGQLQYRENSIHGNPFLRLLRHEIEALIEKKHGRDCLQNRQAKTELIAVNRELKKLEKQTSVLEGRKSKLLADLERQE